MRLLRRALSPVLLALLALAWSWPAVLAGRGSGVGRHFDLPGTAWVLGSAHRWLGTLQDAATAWPEGASYGRPDSFLLLLLGAASSGLDPLLVHGLLQVLGTWLSAWAAEALARRLGARRPWSLLAGLAYAFSGPAATALLEGHAYLVFDPWLPLSLLCLLRATGPGARAWHGLAAALCLALTALTSAYLGLAAVLLGGALLLGSLPAPRPGPPLLAAGLGLAFLALYAWAFRSGGGTTGLAEGYDASSRALYLVANSADLAGMLGSSPAIDRFAHAKAAVAPWTDLALACLVPLVLRGRLPRAAAALALGGGLLFLLALGPWLDLGPAWLPLPGLALTWLPEVDLLRHPARLLWGAWLVAGLLASLVASRLAEHRPRATWLLLVAALVDAFLLAGMPARQGRTLLATPGAYAALHGPVLDLRPEVPGHAYELDAWLQAWACAAQLGHGQPIADDCVATRQQQNPAVARSRAVLDALLRDDAVGARQQLEADGFTALSLQPDLFLDGDRVRLLDTLDRLDARPARSTDAGVLLLLYRLSP